MPRKFPQLAFTPAVKAIQEQRGSRAGYARFEQSGPANDSVTPDIAAFIASMDGFYLGTVNAHGYPYIQFRGGYPGFLKVLDDKTLGFADFRGNVQYISVGNLSENDKAFLFLMDYRHRRRLKILGRARSVEGDRLLIEQLRVPEDDSEIERVILFDIEAWDWNCPQHIPIQYSEQEVANLQARIAELENRLSQYTGQG
ncbi:MAG: pyridoxamine 5'-phosphate oxidase family protein [Thermosynechococcaceae cyanobacterium]